jgi:hypothetical protein
MNAFYELLAFAIRNLVAFQRATGFPEWVNNHSAVWPVAETVHFIGLCLLIGAVGLFDLRLVGVAKSVPVATLKRLLPWGVAGFILCVLTGVLFVAGNAFAPGEYLRNISFLFKMLCLLLAGLNLLAFHVTGMNRAVDGIGAGESAPLAAKFMGAASIVLWVGVIVFGRFLPTLGDAF